MILRLRICNDLLFYDDYRPGFSSAFVVVSEGSEGFRIRGYVFGVVGCVRLCGSGGCVGLLPSSLAVGGCFLF